MNRILDFAVHSEVNVQTMKKFASLVFEREKQHYNLPPTFTLKVRPILYGVNGYVRTMGTGQRQRGVIVVNSRVALHTSKQHSNFCTWFYVYATIVHELEHVRLTQELERAEKMEFKRLIAALYQYNRYSWMYKDNIFRGLIPIPEYTKLQNRMTSLPELICTLVGFNRAYDVLGGMLQAKEKETVVSMVESLTFLCDHIEIIYGTSKQPYNQFAQNIITIQKIVGKDISVLGRLKQLQNVFDPTGVIRSPIDLYKNRTDDEEYCDSLLIRLFLVYDLNWEHFFHVDNEFFRYMEMHANAYCKRSLYYLKNMQKGEVFLNTDVLQDNAAMLIRNTERLNALMKKFGMKNKVGSVFALYD